MDSPYGKGNAPPEPIPNESLQTLTRGLDVLGAFVEKDEIGISELSRRLGFPKSMVHRILRTLAFRGFVEQTAARRYRLGVRALEIGNAYRLQLNLISLAEPALKALSQASGSNCHLAKLDGCEIVDLLRVELPAPLRISRTAMLRRPVHCTALGKALLAYSHVFYVDKVIKEGLTRLTRRTITDPKRFADELRRVRKVGYAVDDEEFYPGSRCIAAPIFDEQGAAIAALSVSSLITNLTEDRVPRIASMVRESAAQLSKSLGFTPQLSD